jgi:hypothetical protein
MACQSVRVWAWVGLSLVAQPGCSRHRSVSQGCKQHAAQASEQERIQAPKQWLHTVLQKCLQICTALLLCSLTAFRDTHAHYLMLPGPRRVGSPEAFGSRQL